METSSVTIAATKNMPVLQQGDNGEAVRFLQKLLIRYGYTDNTNNPIPFDANFGPKTKQAVIKFQMAHSFYPLIADGVVGQNTWRAIADYL